MDSVAFWSCCNKLQLNVDKCKELTLDFKKIKQSFAPITINGLDLDLVNEVKILGVTITDNLLWNNHISDIIKKAKQETVYRACVPNDDSLDFYCTLKTCPRILCASASPQSSSLSE